MHCAHRGPRADVQNRSFTQPRPLMESTGDLAIHADVALVRASSFKADNHRQRKKPLHTVSTRV